MTLPRSPLPDRRAAAPALGTALLLVAALAGCLAGLDGGDDAGGAGTGEAALAPFSDPLTDAHDHLDPELHRHSWRMEELAWDPMVPVNQTARAHAMAAWGDYLFVDGGLSLGEPARSGFWVYDVSDPSDPRGLHQFFPGGYESADGAIAVSSDGNWLVLGSEAPNQRAGRQNVLVFDVSDKSDPQPIASARVPGGGPHTVEIGIVDGEVYVFALNWGVQVFHLRDTGTFRGYELVPVGRYVDPGVGALVAGSDAGPQERTTEAVRTVYGHDMTFVDGGDDGPLLFVSYAYQGLHVLDISDPTVPRVRSKWVPGGDGAPYYVHGAETAMLDGRRITVVGSEVFENRNEQTPSPVWVLDTTDPADPQHLGTWTNPGGHGSQSLLFSAHFFRIDAEAEVLYLSHYHGGVWAVDLSTEQARAEPRAVGYLMPANDNGYRPDEGCCGAFDLAGIPMTFDVEVAGGAVWAADWHTGLYGLRLVDGALDVPAMG